MNRWSVRIVGLLMLLFFAFLFVNLQKQLTAMQKANSGTTAPAPTSTR
jgi:hypothetical protein